MQTSGDGRYLVLTTTTPIVPPTPTTAGSLPIDADTVELIRVSTNTAGIGGNGDNLDATIAQAAPNHAPRHQYGDHQKRRNDSLSSPEQLSPQDGNGLSDVYLWSWARST